MATFVSLATCPHFPAVTSRRGLVYRDSLSIPGGFHRPPSTRLQVHSRPTRPHLPQCITLAGSKPPGGMKHLVLTHLRKLLMLSSAQQRVLHLPV